MVSEYPMFSLKFKSFSWEENKWVYYLIGIGIVSVILLDFMGISVTIVGYIALSYFKNVKGK
jgi:CDP-diacylglycerol--serine O-phosphatidyltransferase